MNLKQYHPTVKKIIELLEKNSYWYQTFELEAVRTSEEAAKIRTGYTLEQGAKALIMSVKESKQKKYFAQFIVPGNSKVNSKILTKLMKAKSIRFAMTEEIEKLTGGILIGGIPPFGNLFDIPVYVDSSLLKNEKIIFNAGDRKFSVGMKVEDYLEIIKPVVAEFTI